LGLLIVRPRVVRDILPLNMARHTADRQASAALQSSPHRWPLSPIRSGGQRPLGVFFRGWTTSSAACPTAVKRGDVACQCARGRKSLRLVLCSWQATGGVARRRIALGPSARRLRALTHCNDPCSTRRAHPRRYGSWQGGSDRVQGRPLPEAVDEPGPGLSVTGVQRTASWWPADHVRNQTCRGS
jgi:hypothetical protein